MIITSSEFQPLKNTQKIVFFDGVCGFCNRWVNFLIHIDTRQQLRYAPLQGETAKELLPADDITQLNAIVFVDGQNRYTKSSAIFQILLCLGEIWYIPSLLIIIPRVLRDFIYDFIAKHRYKLFGKLDACRMPDERTKGLFLP